jgi:hypothetical protein
MSSREAGFVDDGDCAAPLSTDSSVWSGRTVVCVTLSPSGAPREDTKKAAPLGTARVSKSRAARAATLFGCYVVRAAGI